MSKEDNTNKLIVVSDEDMAMVENNTLNPNQLAFLFRKTPKEHISERPAKGGGKWSYVTGVYVKKILNLMFGWDWDFEIVDEKFDLGIGQCYVKGKLTCRTQNKTIVKMQFGRADIKFKTEWIPTEQPDGSTKNIKTTTTQPLDIGNDLKAATTDALKKCASELGIASDVYAPNEFKEIHIKSPEGQEEVTLEELETLFKDVDQTKMSPDDILHIERVIQEKETASYRKAITLIKNNIK